MTADKENQGLSETMKLVKSLRDKTGAGVSKCKKALEEAAGNIEKALEALRKMGQADARKRADHTTGAGLIGVVVKESEGKAGVIELRSETDFVARNEFFTSLVNQLADLCCKKGGSSPEKLSGETLESGASVSDTLTAAIAKLGENIVFSRSQFLEMPEGKKGVVCYYVHQQIVPGVGSRAAVVALASDADKEKLLELGKQIAMHIVAFGPEAVKIEGLPADVVEKERQIFHEQSKDKAKNDTILAKMVEGRLKKYYQEVVLYEQPFAMDSSVTVKDFIDSKSKELGSGVEVVKFVVLDASKG